MRAYEFVTEKFQPNQISFGTNPETNNSKYQSEGGIYSTFFQINGIYYCVCIDDSGLISFSSSNKFSDNMDDYSYTRIPSDNVFRLFNSIIYVLSFLISKLGEFTELSFSGNDDKLHKMYTHMVSTTSFKNLINHLGYVRDFTYPNSFVFTKR